MKRILHGGATQVCNDPAGAEEGRTAENMHSAVQQQVLQTVSAIAGGIGGSGAGSRQGKGRKLNVLLGGRSLIVDVAAGGGIEELGNELVSIAKNGICLIRVSSR